MKKLLYGTTALAAVGLMAGSAGAAEKIKMGVGGYFQGFFVYADEDDGLNEPAAGRRNTAVKQEGEIIFNGSTTLDNGIQFGVQVQLEAETCGDQIDESFMWASGSFGRINVGSENSAAYLMHYASPAPSGWSHGLNSPNFSHATTGGFTNYIHTNPVSLTSDDEKITYFTPRMAGFQLGASYTPDNGIEENTPGDAAGSYGGMPFENNGFSDVLELGINYVNKFNGVDVAISGSYGTGDDDLNIAGVTDDRDEWSIGAQIGIAGFTIGAAYREDNRGLSGSFDRTDYNVGVRYATGPWGVGVQYAHAEQELGGAGEPEVDAFEVGGSYDLGPGVQLQAGVQFWDADNDNLAVDGESTIVFVGTFLSF